MSVKEGISCTPKSAVHGAVALRLYCSATTKYHQNRIEWTRYRWDRLDPSSSCSARNKRWHLTLILTEDRTGGPSLNPLEQQTVRSAQCGVIVSIYLQRHHNYTIRIANRIGFDWRGHSDTVMSMMVGSVWQTFLWHFNFQSHFVLSRNKQPVLLLKRTSKSSYEGLRSINQKFHISEWELRDDWPRRHASRT